MSVNTIMSENPDKVVGYDVPTIENNTSGTKTYDVLKDCPNSGSCLLCISDLEGCQLQSKVDQHTHFCSSDFFDALTAAMTDNPEMQIVFLGDYFDQGPHMVKSITRIVALFEEFNKENERVHIILGNRDVNKLRIPLEATLSTSELKSFTWIGQSKTTTIDDNSIPFEKTKQLIGPPPVFPNTYGASNLFKNLAAELNNKNVDEVSDEEEVAEFNLFDTIFNISQDTDESEFAKAIKLLFTKGKLIKTITIKDTTSNITSTFLAAHAGTIHTCVFDATALSEIMNKPVDLEKKYFELIEEFRNRLIFDNGKVHPDIDNAIKFYDNLLSAVVEPVFKTGIVEAYKIDEFKIKYSLLQAFGLSAPGSVFRSPIQSCGLVNGCGKFVPPETEFVTLLQNTSNNIKGCIHGHIPFCGTVPLIFKTPDANGIVEIACDTSNGNRPKQFENRDVELDEVPLAIVYPYGAGITSIGIKRDKNGDVEKDDKGKIIPDGTFSNKRTLGLSNNGKDNRYQGMIDFFEFDLSFPQFPQLDSKKIIYPKGEFSFAAESGFLSANFGPPEKSTTATVVEAAGGKRKTRRHKITKNKNKRNNKKGKTLRNKKRTIRKR